MYRASSGAVNSLHSTVHQSVWEKRNSNHITLPALPCECELRSLKSLWDRAETSKFVYRVYRATTFAPVLVAFDLRLEAEEAGSTRVLVNAEESDALIAVKSFVYDVYNHASISILLRL